MRRISYNRSVWLTASAAMAVSAVPASGEVYLTEVQALAAVLGNHAIVRSERKLMDEALRMKLERTSNVHFPEASYNFFIAAQDGKPVKYALVLNEIGKSEPITFMVGMSPEGKVTDVVIMVFRENRGWEVKEKRFLNQFRGKSIGSAIRVDEDIINYTGATLSSKAVARGVKRALVLLDAFYPGEARYQLAPAHEFARPGLLSPLVTMRDSQGSLGLYRQARYAMGTVCEIRVWCRDSDEAHRFFSTGFQELGRVEEVFSAYREDSELSRVNREAGQRPVVVSQEFLQLAQDAIVLSHESNGAVDITVGPLLTAWGMRQGELHLPSEAQIKAAQRLVGTDKLRLDQRTRTVRFKRPEMELDFGGIAKGYAAERIAWMLRQQGAVSALVNLGRSSLCASEVALVAGREPAEEETGLQFGGWPIAIAHPDGASRPPLLMNLRAGMSLSTSGTSERQFEVDGKKFSHILDPAKGSPLEGTRSATVISRSGTQCEALSKELLLGAPENRRVWGKQKSVAAWAHMEFLPTGKLLQETGLGS